MTGDEYVPTIVQVGVAILGAAATTAGVVLFVRWWRK